MPNQVARYALTSMTLTAARTSTLCGQYRIALCLHYCTGNCIVFNINMSVIIMVIKAYVSMLDRNSMYVVYCLSLCILSAHIFRLMEGLHVKVGSPSWSKWQMANAIASRLFFSASSLLQSLLTMLKDFVKQSVPNKLLTKVSRSASCCSSVRLPTGSAVLSACDTLTLLRGEGVAPRPCIEILAGTAVNAGCSRSFVQKPACAGANPLILISAHTTCSRAAARTAIVPSCINSNENKNPLMSLADGTTCSFCVSETPKETPEHREPFRSQRRDHKHIRNIPKV